MTHGLGHDAAEVLPMGHADGEPLGVGLLGIGDLEVCQSAGLPLRVDARRQEAPSLGGQGGCGFERQQAHQSDDAA